MKRISVPLLIAAALALPAAAHADTLVGKTSQNRKAKLALDDKGVPKGFFIVWQAKCSGATFIRFTAKIAYHRPLGSPTTQAFKDGGDTVYRQKGGYRSTATTAVTGRRVGNTRWEGTFGAKVIVRKGGRKIDRCAVDGVTWSVESSR